MPDTGLLLERPMRLYGLTGGIGSGKPTVAAMLRQLGAQILDADAIYHHLIHPVAGNPSPLARAIATKFPGILTLDGHIDRGRLAQAVFGKENQESRQQLNAIAHPAVAAEVQRRTDALAGQGIDMAVYDVPLLFERNLEKSLHGVVVVWAPESVCMQRLMARGGLTEDQARQRLAAQIPIDEKRQRAHWVIDNSGDLKATQRQVEALWKAWQDEGITPHQI
ncbi:MAG: dephospho-CoA kinase [Myxococcota bacterium]